MENKENKNISEKELIEKISAINAVMIQKEVSSLEITKKQWLEYVHEIKEIVKKE